MGASAVGDAVFTAEDAAEALEVLGAAAAEGYDVILLAGQSNMQGADNSKDNAIDVADSRIFEWPCSGAHVGTIQPAVDPLDHVPGAAATVGPGIPFARWWLSQVGPDRKVLLVPAAYYGMGFEASSPDTARWKTVTGKQDLYQNAIDKTNGALAAAGPGARLVAVLWCQGEADSATSGATYQADLLALIDGFRANITGAAMVPFVLLSMVPDNFAGNAGRTTINNVHVDVPYLREYCGYGVGLTGHSVGASGVHYDAVAQRWNGSVALPAAFRRALGNKIGTAPNAPTGVRVSQDAITPTTVNVTWTAAAGRVTDYTVQYRTAEGESWSTLTRTRSLACSAAITGLGYGAVEVRVSTVNENGTSDPSASAKLVLMPTPTVSVVQTASDTVTVTTSAVLGSAAYRFDYKLSSASSWTNGTIQAGLTGTISGLSTSAYDFRVTAFTPMGAAVVASTSYTLGSVGINPASITATIAQAYGLRKTVVGYSGYAIKVRRSSDNTEQDIGFSGNDLDTAALLTFCGAGSGYVSKWYDQSGNSRDMAQATTGSQPKIVNSGVLVTNNGRAAMLFDGTDDYMERTTAELYSSGAATVCGVASGTSTANTQECILGEGGTGSNNARYFINKCANAKFGFNVVGDASGSDVLTQDLSDTADAATFGTTPTQWTFVDSGTQVTRYRGGTGLINNTITSAYSRSGKTLTLNRQTIGALHRLAVGNYAAFQPSELVIINAAANNTDRQFIEANQKTYFGTPAGL